MTPEQRDYNLFATAYTQEMLRAMQPLKVFSRFAGPPPMFTRWERVQWACNDARRWLARKIYDCGCDE